MNSRTLKALLFLAILIFLSAAMGAAYFYVTTQQKLIRDREEQISAVKRSQETLRGQVTKFQKRQKTVVTQNRSLRDQAKAYENQRNVILSQVRNSVANFETFRAGATNEIIKLRDSVGALETEKKATEDKLQSLETLSKTDKEKMSQQISEQGAKIDELKSAESQLVSALKNKDKNSMVTETAKMHYNLGNFYFRNHEYPAAAAEYKKTLFYAPNDSDANFNLALVCDDFLDDRQTAIDCYKKYMELKPKAKDALQVRERVLDLENRDKVIDHPAPKVQKEIFKSNDGSPGKFNFIGDKR